MASLHCRSLWISDVHLGFKECKAEFLLDFLRQSECEQLYLVGDLIDFWSLQRGGRWPSDARRGAQSHPGQGAGRGRG
jgi:UDP-2,3-diacylglucosamine pyrophosphatase LpxH